MLKWETLAYVTFIFLCPTRFCRVVKMWLIQVRGQAQMDHIDLLRGWIWGRARVRHRSVPIMHFPHCILALTIVAMHYGKKEERPLISLERQSLLILKSNPFSPPTPPLFVLKILNRPLFRSELTSWAVWLKGFPWHPHHFLCKTSITSLGQWTLSRLQC